MKPNKDALNYAKDKAMLKLINKEGKHLTYREHIIELQNR